MQPINWIGNLQFIGAIPLFCHNAGNRITQLADAVGLKQGFTLTIQAWDQSFHLPSFFIFHQLKLE